MKKDIHPTYHKNAKIACSCGAEFEIGSTEEKTRVELCSQCHPFYTGEQKIIDTARRVEKFKEKAAKQAEAAKGRKGKTVKYAEKKAKKDEKVKKVKIEEQEVQKKPKAKPAKKVAEK